MQLTTTITNADQVKLGIRHVGEAIPRITRRRLDRWLRFVVKISVPYNGGTSYSVPERGYQRTGELGRRTTTEVGENQTGIYGKVISTAKHSVYVIGNAEGSGQASIHHYYWVIMRDAFEQQIGMLLRDYEADLSEIVRSAGAGL